MVTGHAQAARDPAAGLGQRTNVRLTSVLVSGADDCSSVGDYYFNPPVQLPPMAAVVIGNWIQSASANCTPLNGWQNKVFNITIPAMVIPRDAPIGTTLFSQTLNFPSQAVLTSCPKGVHDVYAPFNNGWVPDSSGVAPTNVPGIGIRIADISNAQVISYYRPASNGGASRSIYTFDEQDRYNWTADGFSIQLLKTGPTSTGSLRTGTVAGLLLKNLYWMTAIQIANGGSFSTSGCTVNTKSLTVPLGSVKRSEFSGVGSTTKISNFNIFVDCSESTKINMTLNATADSSNAPGVIAIDPSVGGTTAKGVGIQLLRLAIRWL
ncbi:fimbrial protein [Pseudomonas sp. R62]|uniref:fimbrial protein n=1 Tax=Pseudomonas sp. R62 TaxID=1144884 RepID=UPI0012FB1275|nr:fimbrial protein [Pseudomonas sp. R62]